MFRNATEIDFEHIWEIILYAKESRKLEGSTQWQDGYPNQQQIYQDIQKQQAFVWEEHGRVLGYTALIFDTEPAYECLEG